MKFPQFFPTILIIPNFFVKFPKPKKVVFMKLDGLEKVTYGAKALLEESWINIAEKSSHNMVKIGFICMEFKIILAPFKITNAGGFIVILSGLLHYLHYFSCFLKYFEISFSLCLLLFLHNILSTNRIYYIMNSFLSTET